MPLLVQLVLSLTDLLPVRGGNQSSAAGNFVVGSDGITGASQPWRGLVPEVIAYTNPKSGNENQRINSYLGIKYGLTLRTGGVDSGTFDYLSSTSVNVWNGTANSTYHNNVFGIARDDAGALYQKQSKSANEDQKLIIGAGSSLFNMNSANTNSLTNGQFLMTGDNGLRQSLSVALSNPAAQVNYRFASIWKVQNIGNMGNVIVAWPKKISNLHLIRSTDPTFDTSDEFVPMTSEVTVNGTVYNTAVITFNNGDYFTFGGYTHAPGGVANSLSYWYRADKDAANNGAGTEVTSWKDFFSGTVSSQLGTNPFPKYVTGAANYFNFNPGINFIATNQSLGNTNVRTVSELEYDIFTFTKEGLLPGSTNTRIFSSLVNNANQSGNIAYWDGIGINKRFNPNPDEIERVDAAYAGRYLANPGNINFSTTIPSIMYHRFTNTEVSKGLNGVANGVVGTHHVMGYLNGGHAFGSTIFSGNGSDNDSFRGSIGETIIYGAGSLTETERRRVDSYLAIKYGLTLGRTATNHYLSSTESVVWNGGENASFNNNIFGIGRDDISALHQKVSNSVNSGTILTIATDNDFVSENLAASRTAISDDQEFLITGDNNIVALPMQTVNLGNGNAKIIQREWLLQRTGTMDTVYFQADLSAYESQFYNPNVAYMIIADDANFTVNRILVQGTKTTGKWVFNHDFNTENTKRYITFGTLENAVCYKPGAIATAENPALISKVGISSLTRAGIQNSDNWPAVRNGAWLVLEARTKGFVVNRMPFNTSGNPVGIPAADFVEGMLVYDTTNKCLKMYTSQNGDALAWFCVSTQTCPD
ncbi:hypothetical protein [Chryseobacterium lathyri]|uniref:DUF8202 domain-containing protein n=1 Tax=Chryseobacterium lathyri TaxID=395933 RepID=A0ABT9SJJ1_9FLAO|nr:hypothetical protein [Chryseobacterium lathyri]MDP9959601.1 hypothetical protein [Chryseobacterium lathyri]